jgi:hypothetical protein
MSKIEKTFEIFTAILGLPVVIILILTNDIISGIWLAILGEWELIISGILFAFFIPYFLSVLMLPRFLLAPLALYFYEKKNLLLGFIFGFINLVYVNILIVCTCIFAFLYVSDFYNGNISVNYIPYLSWSYGIGLGPWFFIGSKERDNVFVMFTLYISFLLYTIFLISIFIFSEPKLEIVAILVLIQTIIIPFILTLISYQKAKTLYNGFTLHK